MILVYAFKIHTQSMYAITLLKDWYPITYLLVTLCEGILEIIFGHPVWLFICLFTVWHVVCSVYNVDWQDGCDWCIWT